MSTRTSRAQRLGFTLIELLVVVAILIILVGVLTTALQPVLAGKEIREAARSLNAFFAASVARAAETGRPAGVWIERSSANTNGAFDVFFADVPPLYAGDFVNDRATFTSTTQVTLPAGQASVAGFIGVGDRIRFDFSGPWYEITTVSGLNITYLLGGHPAPPHTTTVPFQVLRGPRKSLVSPMQLPSNTVIDLANSGVGASGTQFNNATQTDPVVIMFSPDASIDRIYYHDGTAYAGRKLTAMLHVLVGRSGQIGAGNLGAGPNDNRWVSVNHQTGRVITTENMGGSVSNARLFATSGQGMGGG